MSKHCRITVTDEVFCTITGILPSEHESLWNTFGVFVDGYFFMPQYKMGRFDGKARFYWKTGKTYVRLLPNVLPHLEKWGYDIELVDKRAPISSPQLTCRVTKVDAQGIAIEAEGQDVFGDVYIGDKKLQLRPYQVQCVVDAVEAGNGFIIAGTGAGKTLITAAISQVYGLAGNRIITIVPSDDLVQQTFELYESAGLDVGQYSGTDKDIDHTHVVATWQALQYNPDILQYFQGLIWDECFSGDTLVLMHDLTWKKIKDIVVGDVVISQDSNDGAFEPKAVQAIHHNLKKSEESKMLRLHLSSGETIDVTENHIFYTSDGRKVAAKDLTIQDDICEFSINKMKTHGDKANEEERN